MTTPTRELPDYAPLASSLGPALNERGNYVGRVERSLFWVTEGTYNAAFLLIDDGVVPIDAPPTMGNNLRQAIDALVAEEGVTNMVSTSSARTTTPTRRAHRAFSRVWSGSATKTQSGGSSGTTTDQAGSSA
jgi:hypothetical protein